MLTRAGIDLTIAVADPSNEAAQNGNSADCRHLVDRLRERLPCPPPRQQHTRIKTTAIMNPAKLCMFSTMLLAIAVLLCGTGSATAAGHSKSKSKSKSKSQSLKPLPPGPEWADTNHDGQLSNEEFQRAKQMLEEKIKKAKADTKTTKQ
jgi:hypothetical protein